MCVLQVFLFYVARSYFRNVFNVLGYTMLIEESYGRPTRTERHAIPIVNDVTSVCLRFKIDFVIHILRYVFVRMVKRSRNSKHDPYVTGMV